MGSNQGRAFPLSEQAVKAGVLESGNGLIVAPTATGKSYIGRAIFRAALARGEPGVHVYLVPYRALASEIYNSFLSELHCDDVAARVMIVTGDHTDPICPHMTDILVATYERFTTLLRRPDLRIGRVVVDEVHLVADQTRGPVLEGLLARLKFHKRPQSLCALSAVVANPEAIGAWLGIPVVLGDKTDRMVEVEFFCEIAEDADGKLKEELVSTLKEEEQAIIFCRSKAASQSLTRNLRALVTDFLTEQDEQALSELAHAMTEDDEDAQELLEMLSGGIAFHHAGLSRESRNAVKKAFRERHLKVIACTPTLVAGVNLPARLVVVRDVFRMEFVRCYPKQVMLSTGELVNMLGRAGRPGQVEHGGGVAIVVKDFMDEEELADLQTAILDGKGNPVKSRMPDSFDSLMRFLLSTTADRASTGTMSSSIPNSSGEGTLLPGHPSRRHFTPNLPFSHMSQILRPRGTSLSRLSTTVP